MSGLGHMRASRQYPSLVRWHPASGQSGVDAERQLRATSGLMRRSKLPDYSITSSARAGPDWS